MEAMTQRFPQELSACFIISSCAPLMQSHHIHGVIVAYGVEFLPIASCADTPSKGHEGLTHFWTTDFVYLSVFLKGLIYIKCAAILKMQFPYLTPRKDAFSKVGLQQCLHVSYKNKKGVDCIKRKWLITKHCGNQ